MLHKDPFIISEGTFKLIQNLQSIKELKNFHLVGGTALALQLGHRNSIDIDLFTVSDFSTRELVDLLEPNFSVEVTVENKNTLLTYINEVKTDFICHKGKLVKEPVIEESISFLSKEDISAMKLYAIVNSGKRLKDFIDVYFLLEHFSVREMLGFFEIKYPSLSPMIPLKALTHFKDIDPNIDPPKLLKSLPVKKIQERIKQAVKHSTRVF